MKLKDSGSRRDFETGTVRDAADGKGRCDLLPLGVIGGYLGISELLNIENYIRQGKTGQLYFAINTFSQLAFNDI